MLEDALGVSGARFRLLLDEALTGARLDRLEGFMARRIAGEPLCYVLGHAPFMGHDFMVDRRVLIPRQDTELLAEEAIKRARNKRPDVLELCTGSGCVAVSIKLSCPSARVTATDLSPDALAVARGNAERLGADVEFMAGDFLEAVSGRTFDVIAVNPPYLTGEDMASLQREVRFEPEMALYGGEDGLGFYRRAAREIRAFLKPGGWALFEVGAGQAREVGRLLGGNTQMIRDLNQIERLVALFIEG